MQDRELRRYEVIWHKLLAATLDKEGNESLDSEGVSRSVRVRTTSKIMMARIRKGVYKEKDKDLNNRGEWRLQCVFTVDEKTGAHTGELIFSLRKTFREEDI